MRKSLAVRNHPIYFCFLGVSANADLKVFMAQTLNAFAPVPTIRQSPAVPFVFAVDLSSFQLVTMR